MKTIEANPSEEVEEFFARVLLSLRGVLPAIAKHNSYECVISHSATLTELMADWCKWNYESKKSPKEIVPVDLSGLPMVVAWDDKEHDAVTGWFLENTHDIIYPYAVLKESFEVSCYSNIKPYHKPKTRAMTQEEVAEWSTSEESIGWMITFFSQVGIHMPSSCCSGRLGNVYQKIKIDPTKRPEDWESFPFEIEVECE